MIIAGDTQVPLLYPSIARATRYMGWSDPLNGVDPEGQVTRPLIYSHDFSFSGEGDGRSSIDAVLLNSPAFFALEHCECGRQRRPIKCVFQWQTYFPGW